MSLNRRPLKGTICVAVLLGLFETPIRAEPVCKEPDMGSKEAPMLSPPTLNVVTGAGRLQFYSAPNADCSMKGIFVIPKDELIAYARTDDGWSSVMYMNPRTTDSVSGWVRSERLKQTGTVGPKQ
ncbi:hypothetical protein XH89_04360 [Bradyrhizobium sp. CCBAU 53340]|nr:hypothetical protein XH89_04360 [Bradyrhizobium sp. CCBAU 53340]